MNKLSLLPSLVVLFLISHLAKADPLINGISIHSELGQESFIGALFTTTLSSNSRDILIAQEEKQIQVRILASRISSRRFKKMWIEGMAINAAASELEAQSKNMAAFSNMLKVTLIKGDIFSIQRSDQSVKIVINGSMLGEIEDTSFFDLLLRTWIGPVPLSSKFREGLLVRGDVNDGVMQRFNGTKPSDKRITAIAAALLKKKEETAAAKPTPDIAVAVAVPKPKPKVSTPVLQAPSIPSPVEITPAAPKAVPKVVVAPPKPTPTPKTVSKPKVVSAPTQAVEDEPSIDDILDTDDEEFTAESLLSQQLYIAKLKKWTNKELRYPSKSMDRGEEGTVRLRVTLSRAGKVKNITVIEEPESKRLTKAAVKAVEKSQPYPSVPDDVNGETFDFTLPIVFKLL